MLKEQESFTDRLKDEITTQAGRSGVVHKYGSDAVMSINKLTQSLGEDEMEEDWSEKYKKSIDCNNPKGFSQRAHCQGRKKKMKENITEAERTLMARLKDLARKHVKGDSKDANRKEKIQKMFDMLVKQLQKGTKVEMEHDMGKEEAQKIALDHLEEFPDYYTRLKKAEATEATGAGSDGGFEGPIAFKDSEFVRRSFDETPKKVEATEATGAGSSGSYETTASWAKSMKKKDWRGASKTQIPGGKFVQVKKKCKKFPYCNQGDIKALKIWENETLQKVITDISKKQNISESVIKNIIAYELGLI
jgi:hypothetical protein